MICKYCSLPIGTEETCASTGFCCIECERDYGGCATMYPDAEDPVKAYWGEKPEAIEK